MNPSYWFGAGGDKVLAVLPFAEYPTPASLSRLTHEYGLREDLDSAWALQPLELVRERGRVMLTLQSTGGEPLERLKLLAKTAEERYQTAAGAESDLRRCLAECETRGDIDEFPPGEHDTPGRLLIPEKLYGRASEIDTLLSAFDRVIAGGRPELVLVSGYSGIGKSAVGRRWTS